MIIILVTGGYGFIGSNFIRFVLEHRNDAVVINLDLLTYAGIRSNLRDVEAAHSDTRYFFVHGDIGDQKLVDSIFDGSYFNDCEMAPNYVVNFAAETHVDRSIDSSGPFLQTNVLGTYSLLESARRKWLAAENSSTDDAAKLDKPIYLQVSTDEVYGDLGETGLFTEDSPLTPNNPYAASKASSDLLVQAYHKTYGLPAIISRSCNNYGPNQFPEKFIPNMIIKALNGVELPLYGDGRNVRDWIHVTDHCEALLFLLNHGTIGQVYNIGTNCEKRNIEVAEEILSILGKPTSQICFVTDRLGHDWRYGIDPTKLLKLGWKAQRSFEEALEQTVSWYMDNSNWCADRMMEIEYGSK